MLSSLLGFGSGSSSTPLKGGCEKSLALTFRKEGVCWAFVSVLSEVVNFLVLGSVSQVSQVWVTGKVPGSTWCKSFWCQKWDPKMITALRPPSVSPEASE